MKNPRPRTMTRPGPDEAWLLADEIAVPVVTFGRQGDVLIAMEPSARSAARVDLADRVPPEGVAVVRGERGGNTHLLVAEGEVRYTAADAGVGSEEAAQLEVGVLEVGDGSVAYLIHPEHRALAFGPGRYVVKRQREFDGYDYRFVAD